MPKFFVKDEQINKPYIKIINDDINHIKNVLRLNVGDCIQICNSDTGENYNAKIEELANSNIKCRIENIIDSSSESNVYIHIFQGLPKADKMELIIQKCTELGVQAITPVDMERSIVKLNSRDAEKKLARWQKIAEVAAKQSMRDIVPQIGNIINIREISEVVNEYDVVLVAYELEKNNYIKNELLKIKDNKKEYKIAVIIGPEGGIEEKEIQVLKEIGCKIISLGKRILRTETVAINVSSIIMYELENGGN